MNNFFNRIGIALTLSVLLSITISLFSNSDKKSSLLRGDFPGFYVLSKIIVDHDASQLYDLDLQRKIQNEAWPELNGSFLISVYPPALALLLSPLGFTSPVVAQIIFSLFSTLCLLLSFNFLKKRTDFISSSPWLLFAFLITNPLLLTGTVGGQNTAFSIGILTLGMALIEKMNKDHSVYTGIAAGLILSCWLLKPQFGIFLFPVLLCFRLWLPLLGYITGGFLQYISGAILLGLLWPIEWAKKLAQFSALNYNINNINQASIVGTLNIVLQDNGMQQSSLQIFSYVAIASLTCLSLIFLTKLYNSKNIQNSPPILWLYFALIPIIAPQTLFYDVGIIFFACLNCLIAKISSKTENAILAVLTILQVIAWFVHAYRESVHYPLFVMLSISYFLLALYFTVKLGPKPQKKPLV